jgi:acetoin utilization deacetylase AcuC-like enzyme
MLLHRNGPNNPERPERLKAVIDALQTLPDLVPISIETATREDLLRVHDAAHIDRIRSTCASHGLYPDPDTQMVPESWEAALLAAGAGISACRAVLDGRVDNAFCAVRPPGHHAERGHAMGFCLFNNVAVAARWLRDMAGIEKVAILDWDVHHGNGTQHAFWEDPTVYFASIHQTPLFPGTGFAEERGPYNNILNVPMEWRCGPSDWLRALDEKIVPEFERFAPDFLLISCGFDAHHLDNLANQDLQAETYGEMTRKVLKIAQGRIVSILEGGYNLLGLRGSALSHVRALKDAE